MPVVITNPSPTQNAAPQSQNQALPHHQALEDITRVEEPIKLWMMGVKVLDPAWCWTQTGLDALVLSPPTHEGKTRDVARQVYHRLIVRFIGGEIYKRQLNLLWIGLVAAFFVYLLSQWQGNSFAAFMGGQLSAKEMFFNALPFLFGVGYGVFLWVASPLLTKPLHFQNILKEVESAVQRCFLRVIPHDTPSDLRDMWRHGWLTSDNRPLSSEITDTDATSMAAYDVARNWYICIAVFFLLALVRFLFGGGTLSPFYPLVILAVAVLVPRGLTNPCEARAKELDRQNAVEGSLLVGAGGHHWAEHQEKARQKQIDEVKRDHTPLFTLGETTGILAGRSDFFAPSASLPFALSLRDIQNHVLVLGGTGSGKTSGILRPLARQIADCPRVGLVVMDGKAALPNELKDLPGMHIVDPAHARFSLVSGLTPNEIVDTLADILRPPTESESYWGDSAMGLLRRAAVIAQELRGEWWTLQGIGQLAVSDEVRAEAIGKIDPDKAFSDPLLKDAIFFFAHEWRLLDSRPKSSILSQARTWISTITAHPDLLKWAETEDGQDDFDLMTPLYGGRLGFLIPGHRYGRAGAVATALLKARLYSKIKRRAEGIRDPRETDVVFIIDEAQEVATQDDSTMLAIGRSLGLAMVAATQTIEGINDKLGEAGAKKWLAVYGNAIGLAGRSRVTDAFVADRAGSCWRAMVDHVPGATVRDTIAADASSGAYAAAKHQPSMREWSGIMEITVQSLMPQGFLPSSQKRQAGAAATVNARQKDISASLRPAPLVHPEEMPTLLAEPNLALAVTTRGRVPRRDVIMLKPEFPKVTAPSNGHPGAGAVTGLT